MIFRCKIYENRPKWCKDYPWNEANEIFPDCQFVFVQDGTMYLLPEEQVLKQRTPEEIEEYCLHCGKCCMYWEGEKCIHCCTSLIVEEDMDQVEQERREDLLDAKAIYGDLEEKFAPGSFGCHELLDRLSVVTSIWNERIIASPATIIDPEFYKEAREIANAISKLYQKVGTRHLDASGSVRGSVTRGTDGRVAPTDET